MSDKDPRKVILARRARFVAAAVAGLGLVGCGDDGAQPQPQVCLTPIYDGGPDLGTDADAADTKPVPCLDPIVDTGVDAPDAVDARPDVADGGSDTEPTPCLKIAPDTGDAD